jgi:hypothetical protein
MGFSRDRLGLGKLFAFLAFMQARDRVGAQKRANDGAIST